MAAHEFEIPDSLEFNQPYWWKVTAFDRTGLTATSDPSHFWTWTLGDLNYSHTVSVSDISAIVDHLFITGADITPARTGDLTGDCRISVSDISKIIDYLFITASDLEIGCE